RLIYTNPKNKKKNINLKTAQHKPHIKKRPQKDKKTQPNPKEEKKKQKKKQ
ncbi:hypothetical protein H5A44_23065, partial [Pectobacterium brasiliense]|nr:hypothetical protein [Pectobacterium brasiliense]